MSESKSDKKTMVVNELTIRGKVYKNVRIFTEVESLMVEVQNKSEHFTSKTLVQAPGYPKFKLKIKDFKDEETKKK